MLADISTKELSALEDQLNAEQVLVKKYRTFAEYCTDVQLKQKCNQIADRHQAHFNTLLTYLQ